MNKNLSFIDVEGEAKQAIIDSYLNFLETTYLKSIINQSQIQHY